MTVDEARQVLNVLYVAYPNSYKNWKQVQYDLAPVLWGKHFQNIPTKLVMDAVDWFIDTDSSFAPTLGEIMTRVKQMISVYDADEAWSEIEWITRNVSEGYYKNLRELDDIARTLITESDVRRFKEVSGAMDKAKYSFIQRYQKMQREKEIKAVKTGNLMLIANEKKMAAIGMKPADLKVPQIEHTEEKGNVHSRGS